MKERELLLNLKKFLANKSYRLISGTLSLATLLTMTGASTEALKTKNNNKNESGYSLCDEESSLCDEESIARIVIPVDPHVKMLNYIINYEPTMEEKIAWILDNHHVTAGQFDEVAGGMIAESMDDGTNYNEAYHTTSTLHNRIHDKEYVREHGSTIYDQFTGRNQFSVYAHGSYKKYMGRTDLPGYQAVVDMLFSGVPSHNYLSFKSNSYKKLDEKGIPYEILEPGGNKYHEPCKEENKIVVLTTPFRDTLIEKYLENNNEDAMVLERNITK